MKIRTKLILANLVIVLFLLGSLTYVLMKRSSDLVYEHIVENASLSLSQMSRNMDNKLESYEEIANTLFLNTSLNMILDEKYSDPLEAYTVYSEQFKPFIVAVQATKDILSIYVYTENETFLSANVRLIDEEVRQSDWYGQVMSSRSGAYWSGPYLRFKEEDPVFSLNKRLNNIDAKSSSVVSLEIKLENLAELVQLESQNKRVVFALADGTVLVDSGSSERIERLAQLPFAGKIMESGRGSFPVDLGGASYQVVFETLDSRNIVKGMKAVAFIPVAELEPEINRLRSTAVVLFGIAFLLSAFLIGLFSIRLTRRLVQMSVKMKSVHKENFQSFVEVKGKDEVAQLGEMFNLMVKRVGSLIQEVYQSEIDRKEQELRTKEVELYALQTQINPHFLFNVLNMIRGNLLIAGDRDNAKMIGLLAKSFRMMLKKSGQLIPLSEELEFVGNYLQIQQYRFGNKLSFSIEAPPGMESTPIPKLSIQPLVENTVTHGIELDSTPSYIRIYGVVENGRLGLTVEDNGLGIAQDRLSDIRERLRNTGSLSVDRHIGLRNVHERIRQLYGPDYGLEIDSEEGRGTKVTIWLPEKTAQPGKE